MPDLSTRLHTEMLSTSGKRRSTRSLPRRLYRAVRRELAGGGLYGMEWGDPDTVEPLRFVRDRWMLPYVRGDQVAVEIGPGGGRWTRYLLGFKRLYAVDYHSELLAELKKSVKNPNVIFVQNSGTDFPDVPSGEVDFVFSFGCFVHLDMPLIEGYLANIKGILKPGGNVVIHYSDMNKIMARELVPSFAENTPEQMQSMVVAAGFTILEEDLTTLWHSSLIRFTL
jgi:SAM-dependent methyltransferase